MVFGNADLQVELKDINYYRAIQFVGKTDLADSVTGSGFFLGATSRNQERCGNYCREKETKDLHVLMIKVEQMYDE